MARDYAADITDPVAREVVANVGVWVDREVIPIIGPYRERAEFPFELIPKIWELGYMGGNIRGYGCPGMSAVAAHLMTIELTRGAYCEGSDLSNQTPSTTRCLPSSQRASTEHCSNDGVEPPA